MKFIKDIKEAKRAMETCTVFVQMNDWKSADVELAKAEAVRVRNPLAYKIAEFLKFSDIM